MTAVGALRERVELQAEVTGAEDGSGGHVHGWARLAVGGMAWAKVDALTGRERLTAERPEGLVTHRAILRARDDLAPGMRLIWRGRALAIKAFLPQRPANRCTLLCEVAQ
ncbi:phage head closure protein [Zavarzinia sp. CC-PAN008]|uniref:phage head closure protein n=1 Tax=Zavarzinia sp. CC-PAN008 TaxID=3243332 RepID=UPI003F745B05